MSRHWAVVIQETGEVITTMRMNSGEFVDGQDYDDLHIVKDITDEEGADNFIKTKYWNGLEWVDLPERPTGHYKWFTYQWVFDQEDFMAIVRADRNARLQASDWTQMADSPLNDGVRLDWQSYRQGLRDITDNLDEIYSVYEVPWPLTPEPA